MEVWSLNQFKYGNRVTTCCEYKALAQVVGALTNDQRILESTCVIGDKLSDPWYIDGVRRVTAKAVGTPTLRN